MRMPSLKRIVARDRRLAAIHEAGHVTLARHLDAQVACAWLENNYRSDPLSEKQWIGHCHFKFDKSPSRKTKTLVAMVAVAGAVAEQCWQREPFFFPEAWYDPHIMSESDWDCTTCTPGNPSLELFRIIED